MKEVNSLGRHGDLLIKKIKVLPEDINKQKNNILMEGEATGHHHTLVADPQSHVEVFIDEKGKKYFKVIGKARITHPEHKTIKVGEGFYKIVVEREYDPFAEVIRRVTD
jgi:hypothetical protein